MSEENTQPESCKTSPVKDTYLTFYDLPLNDSLRQAVTDMGFTEATPVQEAVIPRMMEESRDIIALAQTGTGKTAAFGLPVLEKLSSSKGSSALVLCPTRELAIQITGELQSYAARLSGLRVDAVYGGAGYGDQIRSLKQGVDILVATPGRLLDLLNKGVADLSDVDYLVLDEADIMLNMGFKEELDAILSTVPDERQTLLLSATMPPEVSRIAGTYMNDPVTLTMGPKNAAAEGVEHYHFPVHVHEKYAALKRLVDYHPEMYGIVFCRTKASTQEIADRLVSDGYDVESLHGDLSQAQREQVMKKFRRRNLQLIIATDIAARGLDVQDLSHVIHYDLPDEIDIYTHRSGRTGRAGKSGISYAIVGPRERRRLQQIERIIKKKIPKGTLPGGEDIFQRQLMEFTDRLAATEVNESQLAPYSAAMQKKLEDLSREELIQKMVAMQFDKMIDYYHGLPDMTPLREDSPRGKERRDYGKKERAGSFRSKGSGKDRGSGGVEDGYMSISVNLGANDNVAPPDLIGLVNQSSKRRGIEIGRIKIHASRSTMQVEENAAPSTAQALNGFTYRGRTVKAEITEGSRSSVKNGRNGKSSGRRDSNGGNNGGGYGGHSKKSGKVLYAGKLLDD